METPIKVGIIGNGKSANRYQLPFILNRRDKFDVRKIYQRSIRQDWKPIEGVEYTQNLDEILNDPEIELVIITTPVNAHADLAKKAIEAGKNVIVEKPFVETSRQARELFDLAKEKGVMLQCYQNRRFDSHFLTAQEVIKSGKLGDLNEIELCYDYWRPEMAESMEGYDPVNQYLYGHASHLVDQIVSLFGKPDKVHYEVKPLLGEGHGNDYFDLDFYYGPLKVSAKASFFRIRPRPSVTVYGRKGMFVKPDEDRQEQDLKHFYLPEGHPDFGKDRVQDYGTVIYYDDQGKYHEEKVPTINGDYARYYDAVYETLLHGKEQLVSPEQTITVMEILENGANGGKPRID